MRRPAERSPGHTVLRRRPTAPFGTANPGSNRTRWSASSLTPRPSRSGISHPEAESSATWSLRQTAIYCSPTAASIRLAACACIERGGRLFADHVRKVSFVFADRFDEIRVWKEFPPCQFDCPGPAIRRRIVDGELHVNVAEVGAPQPFNEVRLFGLGMAVHIQPTFVIHAGGLDDQGVALPSAHRVTKKGRLANLGQRPPIH